jgi:gamma-glutamylputrescine oxidase
VCIVGGGIAGCSTALHLAERGVSVALLEAERIGYGASGRSGGQALPGFAKGQQQIESLVGREVGRKLWDISVEGLDLVRELIERFRIDCDWVSGQMAVAIKPRQVSELREELISLANEYGYRSVRFVEQRELRETLASDRYLAGLYDSRAGHLHPLNYTLGLARAAQSLGATLYEGTKALRFERRGGRILVDTPGGTVHCRQLVLCGNVYMGDLSRALRSKIMGIGTYIVATEKLGEARARSLITNRAAVTDMNWIIDYFRLSADHRLLFGGRVSYGGLDERASARLTRARMVRVFPQLEDVKIEYAWGGYLDITLNRAPDFGRLEDDIYYLQGFAGHGISLTGMAGKLVAEAIAGNSERFDLFSHIKHRTFPGGQIFRRPALVLAMLYYRARDWL